MAQTSYRQRIGFAELAGSVPHSLLRGKRILAHMTYVIEGSSALVNEAGEEQPLKAGDFALVNPEGLAPENRT